MVFNALTAFVGAPLSGILFTAVLPGGCPLECPFCIVNKRDERRTDSSLTAEHLVAALASIERRRLLGAAAIVGDEPLQTHCWPMAKAFLDRGIQSRVPTALITNGYNLVDFVQELRQLNKTKILISLDAASEKHDEIRRKPGAFARISEGVRLAASDPKLRDQISIATIMMPGNLDSIPGIIDFTASHKIPQLLLSPLLTSSRTEALAVHPKVMKEAWRAIPRLLDHAAAAGVKLRLSDEFAVLGPWEQKLASIGAEILAPKEPARLIRVDAAGRVETLSTMHSGTPTELRLPADITEMDAFVDTLLERCFEQVEVSVAA
ncbi:MAG: radical SAM protein [Burkholderiales bacterium]|nr:radical SAM protein [Phycisphaerae bacterium]